MKRLFLKFVLAGAVMGSAIQVSAQHEHSDIEVGYDNILAPTSLILHGGDFTIDGIRFYESDMEELDPFSPGDFSSDAPGFTTNASEGILVNPGDQLWIRALDASVHSAFGVGYVNYYNPLTNSLQSMGRISLIDNSGSTADLVLNGASIESGVNSQYIDLGDANGGIHDHIIFDLLDDETALRGAYGVLFELQTDFASADGVMDLTSERFWLIWNHGMDHEDFETLALPQFGAAAIPEPGTTLLLAFAGISAVCLRRRRA